MRSDPSARGGRSFPPSFQSRADAVAHPIISIPDVRGTDARSRERDAPEGVTHGFQVSLYKVDPSIDSLACNLLSNNDCRAALLDEPLERGPEVPLIIKPSSFACRAERLAWAGACPDGAVVGPPSESQGEGPSSNPREEVALRISSKLIWPNIFDTPFVYESGRYLPGGDQFPKPCGCVGVEFVVVVHACASKHPSASCSPAASALSAPSSSARSLAPRSSLACS